MDSAQRDVLKLRQTLNLQEWSSVPSATLTSGPCATLPWVHGAGSLLERRAPCPLDLSDNPRELLSVRALAELRMRRKPLPPAQHTAPLLTAAPRESWAWLKAKACSLLTLDLYTDKATRWGLVEREKSFRISWCPLVAF